MTDLGRRIAVGAILASVATVFAYAAGAFTPHALTPARMIDAFEAANGPHPGFRRNHAKGIGFVGSFASNGDGATLSKAIVFAPGRTPVIGRLAHAGGDPHSHDAQRAVRSMAILFHLANGEEWRTGMNDIPVFGVNTPEAFYEQLLAAHEPARLPAFFAAHPESARAKQIIDARPTTSGFETSTYNSLNAFRFVDANGIMKNVRWSMVPTAATAPVGTGENYLYEDLIAAVRAHPLQWHLMITIAEPGDPTNDATLPWPSVRRSVDVGTLTIDRVEGEGTSPARDINFDPLVLPSGILSSDDPLLSARSAAYSASFTRREGEKKEPSAVSGPN